jgi:hypothetical protein
MRHFFLTTFSIPDKSRWINSPAMDELIWRGATLLMLAVVTAIIVILAR